MPEKLLDEHVQNIMNEKQNLRVKIDSLRNILEVCKKTNVDFTRNDYKEKRNTEKILQLENDFKIFILNNQNKLKYDTCVEIKEHVKVHVKEIIAEIKNLVYDIDSYVKEFTKKTRNKRKREIKAKQIINKKVKLNYDPVGDSCGSFTPLH